MNDTAREEKVCVVCGRPFANRKKWKTRDQWSEIKYCSDKCRREKKTRKADELTVSPKV